jgi:transcriptional regulator with XRE-family HTH domain
MSQPTLAAALGITFQQLYKYEKAKNRISASRLYLFSKALSVPVTFFFEDIAETEAKAQKPKRPKTG